MALLYRVGSTRLRPATQLLYARLTAASPSTSIPDLNAQQVQAAPSLAFVQLRSFAAPAQSNNNKPKVKPSENGPRLNNAITSQVVRLVGDEGHCVVSLREALDRARNLDLDLVEVQRAANPPVCKIMNFNKEKYKKELTEKERSKSKSALSKRSGEKKEVRFKAKTEIKDLKVKADAITRLMEKGYRVKCTALPSGNQEEELGEHLSRLLKLIEEVSIIESGPHIDSKQAYAIVRHIKFDTKKPKKSTKISDNNISKNNNSTKSKSPAIEEESEWECDSDSDESTKVEQIAKGNLKSDLVKEEIVNEQNRYAKKETENNQGRFPLNNNNNNNNNLRDFNGQFGNGNPNFSERRNNLPPFNVPNSVPNIPNRNPNFSQDRSNLSPLNFVQQIQDEEYPPNFSQERSNLSHSNFGPNIPNRNPNFSQERSNLPPFNPPRFVPNRNPNLSQERSNVPPFQAPKFVPNIPNTNPQNPNFSQERSQVPPFQAPKFVPNTNPQNPNFSQERSQVPRFQAPKFVPNTNPQNPNFSQERSQVPPFQAPKFGQFRKESPLNPNSANPNFSQERSSATEPRNPKFGVFNSSGKTSESSDSSSQTPKFGVFSTKRTDFSNN